MLVLMPQCRNAVAADKVIQIHPRNVQPTLLATGSLVGWWVPFDSVIKLFYKPNLFQPTNTYRQQLNCSETRRQRICGYVYN